MSTSTFHIATLTGIVSFRSFKASDPVITSTVRLAPGSTMQHWIHAVVISNDKNSIAVRSNTWNGRKADGVNRCGLAQLSLDNSKTKLKERISRKL